MPVIRRPWHCAPSDVDIAKRAAASTCTSACGGHAREALERALHGCLLDAEEEEAGEAAWDGYDDAPWLQLLEQY